MKRDIIIILTCLCLLVLSTVSLFDGGFTANTLGAYDNSSWYTPVTYMFVHANPIHLLLNVIMFFQMNAFFYYDTANKRMVYISSFLISVFMARVCTMELPTVGASGFLFAVLGYICSMTTTKCAIINISSLILYSVIGYIIGVFNYKLHIFCFVTMLLVGFILRYAHKRR